VLSLYRDIDGAYPISALSTRSEVCQSSPSLLLWLLSHAAMSRALPANRGSLSCRPTNDNRNSNTSETVTVQCSTVPVAADWRPGGLPWTLSVPKASPLQSIVTKKKKKIVMVTALR